MKRIMIWLAAASLVACSGAREEAPAPVAQEIPITSASPDAIEHFRQGRELLENLRTAEAAERFNEALKLDPDFAQARAYLGIATPGAAGLEEIERASANVAALPEPERLLIEAALADRRGEFTQSTERWRQLATLLPMDWRAQWGLGQRLFFDRKDAEAAEVFAKVVELNPNAGAALNSLGYAHLRAGNTDRAVEAFQRYASALPNEPNPQDSLGEGLMAAGRFDEAAAAFEKAAGLSPLFWNAWEGVAYAKFYAGDWAAGREALGKAREAATRPSEKLAVDGLAAWATLAEGKRADGLKQLDALEKAPEAQPSDVADIPLDRATILIDAGRHRDALGQIASALERAQGGQLPPRTVQNITRRALALRAVAEAGMRDAAAVEKTVAELSQAAASRPDDPFAQSSLHLGEAMLAVAKGDIASARTHFGQCLADDTSCHWQEVLANERAKDPAAADAARTALFRIYLRDPLYLHVRTTLEKAAAARRTM